MASTPKTAPRRPPAPRKGPKAAMAAGLPDPRPLTGYSVEVTEEVQGTRLTVKLGQRCVVRAPRWALISSETGERLTTPPAAVVDGTTFYFQFDSELPRAFNFIAAPYQDPQVQNFQGGYVAPGAQWFRAPS